MGINLEPIAPKTNMMSEKVEISQGRASSVETIQKAEELGVDFICFTGNPGTGVTNLEITKSVKWQKVFFGIDYCWENA